MREETVKVYLFEELTEEAKNRAWENDETKWDFGEYYSHEYRKTLEEFEDTFGIKVKWEIDSYRFWFDFTIRDNETAENLETIRDPLRLATWIYNNHWWHIRKGKYYSKGGWVNGKYQYKYRHSRVIFTYDDCPLTGTCCDCHILQAVIDCITYRRAFDTFDDLMTTALNEFFEAWRDELEYTETIEYYAETAAANDWEYTADGRRWPR